MLKYIGAGAFLQGVPARDLTEDEAAAHDRAALLASRLYVEGVRGDEAALAVPAETSGEIVLSDGVSDAEATLASKALRARQDSAGRKKS